MSTAGPVPQVVHTFNVEQKVSSGSDIRKLKFALVLLDFLES